VGFTLYLLSRVVQDLRKQIKDIVPRFFVPLSKQKFIAAGHGKQHKKPNIIMKTIFKTVLVVVLAVFAIEASAQSLKVGYVGGNWKEKDTDNDRTKTYSLSGFLVGFDYEYVLPSAKGVSIRPGVNLVYTSGRKSGEKLTDLDVYVPVDVKYAYDINSSLSVYAFAGPRFDVGLISRSTDKYDGYKDSSDKYSGERKITYKGETTTVEGDPEYKRFDLKIGLGTGVRFKKVSFEIGYDFGLINRYIETYDDYTLKRNRLILTVGYNF
jgi:hypothetical protein